MVCTIKHVKFFVVIILVFTATSCQVRSEFTRTIYEPELIEIEIDYRSISVAEEGGIQFTRFSDENEPIIGPVVSAKEGIITWNAAPFIAVSPDGSQIAYIGESNEKRNVYLKNTGGGRSTIQRTFRDQVLDVSFSPSGEHITFSERVAHNHYNIYQMRRAEGTSVQQIADGSVIERSPVYSQDGTMIFYARGEYSQNISDYRYHIWSVNLNTFLRTQYAEGFTPSTSKGNEEIIVVGRNNRTSGFGEIYTINLNTGQETQVASHSEMGFSSPSLSPDGQTILMVGSTRATENRREALDLYTVRIDGTNLTQLTFHPGHDVSPVWNHDGTEIYFISQRGTESGSYGLWRIIYNP